MLNSKLSKLMKVTFQQGRFYRTYNRIVIVGKHYTLELKRISSTELSVKLVKNGGGFVGAIIFVNIRDFKKSVGIV